MGRCEPVTCHGQQPRCDRPVKNAFGIGIARGDRPQHHTYSGASERGHQARGVEDVGVEVGDPLRHQLAERRRACVLDHAAPGLPELQGPEWVAAGLLGNPLDLLTGEGDAEPVAQHLPDRPVRERSEAHRQNAVTRERQGRRISGVPRRPPQRRCITSGQQQNQPAVMEATHGIGQALLGLGVHPVQVVHSQYDRALVQGAAQQCQDTDGDGSAIRGRVGVPAQQRAVEGSALGSRQRRCVLVDQRPQQIVQPGVGHLTLGLGTGRGEDPGACAAHGRHSVRPLRRLPDPGLTNDHHAACRLVNAIGEPVHQLDLVVAAPQRRRGKRSYPLIVAELPRRLAVVGAPRVVMAVRPTARGGQTDKHAHSPVRLRSDGLLSLYGRDGIHAGGTPRTFGRRRAPRHDTPHG